MADPALGSELILVTPQFSRGPHLAEVTLWYGVDDPGLVTAGGLDSVASVVDQQLGGVWRDYMGADSSYVQTVAKYYPAAGPPYEATRDDEAGASSNPNDVLPLAVSLPVTLYTPFSGKSYRGRNYLPWAAETTNTDEGIPSAEVIDAVAAMYEGITPIGPAGDGFIATLSVFSRKLTVDFGPPAVAYPVTSAVPRNRWARQVRRSR